MGASTEAPVVVEVSDVSLERGPNGEPASSSGQSHHLAFRDICFEIAVRKGRTGEKERKTILSPISGVFASGSMVALIGPSGCGKTTLLDIIAGKKTDPYRGEVFLNGRPRNRQFSRITSYVPQQDVMPRTAPFPRWSSFTTGCGLIYPTSDPKRPRNVDASATRSCRVSVCSG